LLVGDAAPRVAQHALLAAADNERVILGTTGATPDAVVVARRAALHYAAGGSLPAMPLYLRPPDVTISAAALS
jgi:hypothetical protein